MKKEPLDLKVTLGNTIRGLRRIKGFTQEELGEKSGLSYKYIGEIERGKVNISIDSLLRIADAMAVTSNDLMPSETAPSEKSFTEDKDQLSKLSYRDIQNIKNALRLLNRVFSKV